MVADKIWISNWTLWVATAQETYGDSTCTPDTINNSLRLIQFVVQLWPRFSHEVLPSVVLCSLRSATRHFYSWRWWISGFHDGITFVRFCLRCYSALAHAWLFVIGGLRDIFVVYYIIIMRVYFVGHSRQFFRYWWLETEACTLLRVGEKVWATCLFHRKHRWCLVAGQPLEISLLMRLFNFHLTVAFLCLLSIQGFERGVSLIFL